MSEVAKYRSGALDTNTGNIQVKGQYTSDIELEATLQDLEVKGNIITTNSIQLHDVIAGCILFTYSFHLLTTILTMSD
jgi:hypothetical protein